MAEAFPLQWPPGWTRTRSEKRSRSRYKVGFVYAMDHLIRELVLLGARKNSIILSSNVPLRRDGKPYADEGRFDDPGVAVYWSTDKYAERVIACDRWIGVHENIHAIGKAVEAMRSIDRCGASQILDQAFSAFGALPASEAAPKVRPWWEVFGLAKELIGSLSIAMVQARYRELAPKCHPDRTGTDAVMAELNRALEQAKAHYAR